MKSGRVLLALVAIGICPVASAESPFDGTWTVNIDKSHPNPEILSWKDAGNGRWVFTNQNISYTFKPDGHEFRTPTGNEQTWEKASADVYRVTTRAHGMPWGTATFKLSPDAKTLYVDEQRSLPNGKAVENHETYTRTSAGSGLFGRWKSITKMKVQPNTLGIHTTGREDVTLTLSLTKWVVHGKWDGRDYPVKGNDLPANATVALRRTGSDAFELTAKVGANIMEMDRFRLATDRKSMTEGSSNAKGRELFMGLWDKEYP